MRCLVVARVVHTGHPHGCLRDGDQGALLLATQAVLRWDVEDARRLRTRVRETMSPKAHVHADAGSKAGELASNNIVART